MQVPEESERPLDRKSIRRRPFFVVSASTLCNLPLMTLICIAVLRQAQIFRAFRVFNLQCCRAFASRAKENRRSETGGKLDREASTRIEATLEMIPWQGSSATNLRRKMLIYG
jgi:hypothetical protein